MKPSLGPNSPLELDAPGEGAPPTPPPFMSVGAVGRMTVEVGVVEVEELVEAVVFPGVAVMTGRTVVISLVEIWVVSTRPGPKTVLLMTEVMTEVVLWGAAVVPLPDCAAVLVPLALGVAVGEDVLLLLLLVVSGGLLVVD